MVPAGLSLHEVKLMWVADLAMQPHPPLVYESALGKVPVSASNSENQQTHYSLSMMVLAVILEFRPQCL